MKASGELGVRVTSLIKCGPIVFAVVFLLKSASTNPALANASPSRSFDVSEMLPKSQSALDLQVEDFERLGICPDEMRLTVIRRAAIQSSRTLAESQLANPSDTAALQLSRVTVSAYRLLDPRQRADAHQRIHVGRILPTVLMWAGQTKFENQQTGGRKAQIAGVGTAGALGTDDEHAGTPFQGGGLSESDLIELMELDSTPLLAGQPAWTQSFSDVDILGRTLFFKRWNRWKRLLLSRWYAIGLAIILVVLFVAALVISPDRDETAVTEEFDSASSFGSGFLDSGKPQTDAYNRSVDPNVAMNQAVDIEFGLGILNEPEIELTDTLESDVQVATPVVSLDSIPGTIVELENPVGDRSVSNRPVPEMEGMNNAASPVLEKDALGFLPDPFASPNGITALELEKSEVDPDGNATSGASLAGSEQLEMFAKTPEMFAKPEEGPEAVPEMAKRIVPDSEVVADARDDIVALDSISMASGNADDVAQRLVALEEVKDRLRLGTPDYWAVSLLLIESAWQTKGVSDVNENLFDLQQLYTFAPAPLLVETYMAANIRSALPEIQQHLLANGLILLDQLLVADQVELAIRILGSVESLSLTLQDTEATENVMAYARVIGQTIRQKERFKLLLSEDPDTWSRSNRGLLGRYYCFVLRRWKVGLPWLSSASDSRVASAAKNELSLPETPAFEDLVALVRLWDLNAGRASGLNRQAMRLHAVFLATKALETASESQRLEFGMELREISENLPEYLRSTGLQLWETTD
ncbi:MAG: hypothetical protein CBE43_03695 [Rhodopirellula sp. TMED283]|nr:MAG: hypothetical protein CBE43_03695 [Rhodopirellula sp. TMED283]